MKIILNEELYSKSGIYIIRSLADKRVYIGGTVQLKKRYNNHFQDLRNKRHINYNLQRFVDEHGAEQLQFELIELCKKPEILIREQYWIDFYKAKGELFNVSPTAGSSLGMKHRPEVKEKMKGRIVSDETREKQSEWQKGKAKPEELKKKWSDGRRKGIPKSEEFKRKMSEAMKGNQNGKFATHSEERRRQIGELNRRRCTGKPLSKEHREKISQNSPLKGIKRSEEYKAKMSILIKEAKARKKAEKLKAQAE